MEEKNQVFSGKPSEKDIEAQIESMLQYELGFSVVVQKMAEVGKPIVGHNMMMDLCFLYQ